MTKIIENAGISNIVLTANIDFSSNGITYKKDDVVLALNNVPAVLRYSVKESRATTGQNIALHHSSKFLQSVVIGRVPLTEKFVSLFGAIQPSNSYLTSATLPAYDGQLFFVQNVDAALPIRVLELQQTARSYTYKSENNTLESASFVDGNTYTVYYYTTSTGNRYKVGDFSDIPYLSLHLRTVGNINKSEKETSFYLPKVSLVDSPSFSIEEGSISYYNLTLAVINSDVYIGF